MRLLDINSIKKGHLLPIIQVLYGVIVLLFVSIYYVDYSSHNNLKMLDNRIMILNQQSTVIKSISLEVFSESSEKVRFLNRSIYALDQGGDIILTVAEIRGLTPETDEVSNQILRSIHNKWDYFYMAYKGYNSISEKKYLKTLELNRVLSEISRLQDHYYSVLKKRKDTVVLKKSTWNTILFICLLLSLITVFYLQVLYKNNLNKINKILDAISKGNIQKVKTKPTCEFNDTYEFIEKILKSQKDVSNILEKIGEGDFSIEFKKTSKKDLLGQAVVTMRDKLHQFFEEDKRKTRISSWTNQGLALFGDIMRNNTSSIESLAGEINNQLVKYLDANQGAIYILDTNEEKKDFLKLVSAYAWDRKKHVEREIYAGEGIVGQVLLEKETTYLTDVPNDFVHITSGLGEANPRSILIVPIKENEEVYGIIEIASFNLFDEYHIELIEKVGESLGSVIANIRTNQETKLLLRDSQLLTEQLRTQEEELRQNTEELQATQENINHKLEIIDFQRQKNEAILEASADGLITFDQNGSIELFNKAAEEIWQTSREDVLGKSITTLMPLEIDLEVKGSAVYFVKKDGRKIPLAIRTEVSVYDVFGEDVPVLITISKSKIGEEMYFALFIQSIAVELF